MTSRRYWIPSTSALLAFDSAARHCNFSRAASELNTSQSAISRHIAALENRLGTRLFQRHRQRLTLTDEGEQFHRAVAASLQNIQTAAMAIANAGGGEQFLLACTHEISHLFVMPRFDALQQALGEDTRIRIMTFEYDSMDTMLEPRLDLLLTYDPGDVDDGDRAVALPEAVTPLCSPGFAAAHRAVLARPPREWGGLTFLKLTRPNRGWATWEDWFDASGAAGLSPRYVGFDNYVYLLEAAAAGRGLALGWRGMVERYLEAGTLVTAASGFVEFERALAAVLTRRGRARATARRALEFFALQTVRPRR